MTNKRRSGSRMMAIFLALVLLSAQVVIPVQAEEAAQNEEVTEQDGAEEEAGSIQADETEESETEELKDSSPEPQIKKQSSDMSEYHAGDVEVIHNIIVYNGLAADKNDVVNWNFVTWSDAVSNKRILKLDLDNKDLIGILDVSGLESLERLDCDNNELKELNVSGLRNLNTVYCVDNELKELNVSGLESLKSLYCYNNELKELNVSELKSLERLECHDNELKKLDVSGLKSLRYLECSNNKLKELDVRGLERLYALHCSDNELKEVELGGLSDLYYLSCGNNQLEELNLDGLTELFGLGLSGNRIRKLTIPTGESIIIEPSVNGSAFISGYTIKSKGTILEAAADLGYEFSEWKHDQNITINNDNYFIMPDSDVNLQAVFSAIPYNLNDIIAMNEMIAEHPELGISEWAAGSTPPAGWNDYVTWSEGMSDKRIEELDVSAKGLMGKLDARKLDYLKKLDCSDNELKELNTDGLDSLEGLRCHNNPIRSFTNTDGYTLTVNAGSNGAVRLTDYNHGTGHFTFTATPEAGYAVRWESTDVSIAAPESDTLNLDIQGSSCMINARFRPLSMNEIITSSSLSETEYTYTGTAHKPDVSVRFIDGLNWQAGVDYEIRYKNNTDAGAAQVVISRPDGYEDRGEHILQFTIAKATPVVSWPEMKWIWPDTCLEEAEFVTSGDAVGVNNTTLPGTFVWEFPDTVPTQSGYQRMMFTPDDTVNYHTVPGSVQVSVNDTELDISGEPVVDMPFTVAPSSYGDVSGWSYDSDVLDVQFFDGYGVFTAKIDGMTRITYTDSAGMPASADIMVMKNTMTGIYAEGYTGVFDHKYHSITIHGVPDGAKVEYSADNGNSWSEINPAYTAADTDIEVHYRVTKPGYHDVTGSAVIAIGSAAAPGKKPAPEEKPAPGKKPDPGKQLPLNNSGSVKTGDNSYLYLWILAALLSAAGIGVIIYKRRNQ